MVLSRNGELINTEVLPKSQKNYVTIRIDTLAPELQGAAVKELAPDSNLAELELTYAPETWDGTEMKIWGDIDLGKLEGLATTEEEATWIPFDPAIKIPLQTVEGEKTFYIKVRDAGWNETAQFELITTVDYASLYTIISQLPEFGTISKQVGREATTFKFQPNKEITGYYVGIVETPTATFEEMKVIKILGSEELTGFVTLPEPSAAEQVVTVTTQAILNAYTTEAEKVDGERLIKIFAIDKNSNTSIDPEEMTVTL